MSGTPRPLLLLILLSLAVLCLGCSHDATSPRSPAEVTSDSPAPATLDQLLAATPVGQPSEEEIEALLLLREEEKLARDVYLMMDGLYTESIFRNIAESEQRHMDAVKKLLDRYGLDDPALGNDIGEFTDPHIQDLYDDLTASGEQSLAGALLAGGTIEEVDILDLVHALEFIVLPEIRTVFESLCDGSENHLRSFVGVYEETIGETYEPCLLTPAEYDAILCGDHGHNSSGSGGKT